MSPQSVANLVLAAAAAFAAMRLAHAGLRQKQPFTFTYFVATALALFCLASLPTSSSSYFFIFFFWTPVSWLLSVLAVREMFALALYNYPGIRSAARRAVNWGLVIALAVSSLITLYSWDGGARGRSALFYMQTVNKSVVSLLAVLIIILLLFLSRYPLYLQSNTLLSCIFLAAAFLSECLAMLIDTASPHLFSEVADTAQVSFAAACIAGWGVVVRRQTAPPVRVSFTKPEEEHLLHQLDVLNSLLTRTGRQ